MSLSFYENLLLTERRNEGILYENEIRGNLRRANIPGLHVPNDPSGYTSDKPGDIRAHLNNAPFFLEVKDLKSVMGSSIIKYDYPTKTFTASQVEDDDFNLLLPGMKVQQKRLDEYIEHVKKYEPIERHSLSTGFTLKLTQEAYDDLKIKKFLSRIETVINLDPIRWIKSNYTSKRIYYFQIRGSGLFYLDQNPLNLPVPALRDISGHLEMRLILKGDKRVWTLQSGEKVEYRRVDLRVSPRIKVAQNSPYDLGVMADIPKVFGITK